MARLLKTNTAARLVVGPFVAITDGYTLKTGMTVTNLAMNLWHEHDDGSAPTQTINAVAFTASGGSTNDMIELAGGYYDIEITAAQTNFLGRAKFQIYDIDQCLPYFEDWLVVPANVYDSLVGGSDYLDVNTYSITDGAVTAAAIANGAIDNATFAADVGTTAYATNNIALAADKALIANNLDHLALTATVGTDMTAEVADNTILSRIIGNGDTSTFVPSTDGLHAAGVDLDAILLDTGTTLDGKADQLVTAVITNAAGVDVAADIIAMQANVTTIMADTDLLDDVSGGLADIHTDVGTAITNIGTVNGKLPSALTANGNMKCSLVEILTTALTETSGYLAAGFKKFFNVLSPTATCLSLPDAVPGANGGLPTTNGTKVSQTVDLTAGQSINASSLTNGAITAAAIATGAIDADALATDAVTEIAEGLLDHTVADHLTSGTVGEYIGGIALASAASTVTAQTRSATVFASDSSYGTEAWDVDATPNTVDYGGGTATTEYLTAEHFDFAIPDGATIQGIQASIIRKGLTGSDSVTDARVRLIDGGVVQSDDNASVVAWDDDYTIEVYGGVADTWAGSWTAAKINADDFGVALAATIVQAGAETTAAWVDRVTVTVTYLPA